MCLLFLAHLEAGQVGVPQDQFVFVFEVLSYCAFDCLAVLLLQRESTREMTCDSTRKDSNTENCGLILSSDNPPLHNMTC